MAGVRGFNQLAGTWGKLMWDGEDIFEVSSFEAKVKVNRESVQNGLSEDSVIVGLAGEGTMAINKIFTRGMSKFLEAYKKGEDPRSTLITSIKSPTSYKKQSENVTLRNVWFNELTISKWEKGQKITDEIPFGFTPDTADYEDTIDYGE